MNDAADLAAWVTAMHSAYNLLVEISGNNAILRDDPHFEWRKAENVARNIDKGKKTVEHLKDTAPLDNLITLAELPRVEIEDTDSVPAALAMSDSPMRPKVQIDDTYLVPTALAMSASPMSDTKDFRPGVGRRDLEGLLPSETPPGALIGFNPMSDTKDN